MIKCLAWRPNTILTVKKCTLYEEFSYAQLRTCVSFSCINNCLGCPEYFEKAVKMGRMWLSAPWKSPISTTIKVFHENKSGHNFEPQKMTRAYVCVKISEYPPPPWAFSLSLFFGPSSSLSSLPPSSAKHASFALSHLRQAWLFSIWLHFQDNRASDFFQDWWAKVTHEAKNGESFSDMMGPSISN